MKIFTITDYLESLAPLSLQESYDNSGLLTGQSSWECTGVITTMDATEEVVMEAVNKNCNLVVAHHPIIFSGLKRINGMNYVERAIIAAIKHDISIYAIHTNLDNVLTGVNGIIADKLGLINRSVLQSRTRILKAHPYEDLAYDLIATENTQSETGSGLIGELEKPLKEEEFLELVKVSFGLPLIRHTPMLGKNARRIAVCGGAGSFLIGSARDAGADFYLTADVKYHEFFDADSRLVIADIGHFESEQFTISYLFDILTLKFPNFAVQKTGVRTNPVHYFL